MSRARRAAGMLAALLALASCERASPRTRDPALRSVTTTGRLQDDALTELSGLAPSAIAPGVFWGHNDSGNDARLFAIDSSGRAIASVHVAGARNRDWEAIAAGPCESGACLYVGDVGDNEARRNDLRVWRVAEPRLAPQTRDDSTNTAVELRIQYSDGAHDVEAMWVAPDTSLWLVTKRLHETRRGDRRPALVYRIDAAAWRTRETTAVAQFVDSLPLIPGRTSDTQWITDASLSSPAADGSRRLAVRTYDEVLVFTADPATGRPGAVLGRCSLAGLRTRDGEAIAWLADGRLLFANEGRGSALHAGFCP